MYVCVVSQPGLDRVLVGPFDKKPSPTHLLDTLGDDYPELADSLEDQGYKQVPVTRWATVIKLEPNGEPETWLL